MKLELSRIKYVTYGLVFLGIVFCVALFQNYIRYSIHESYQIWTSVSYLIVSLILFGLFLSPLYTTTNFIQQKYSANFLLIMGCVMIIVIGVYYVLSSILINLIGFYDSLFSEQYARQYFGREAFIHMVMVALTGFIFYMNRSNIKKKHISAVNGRIEVTLDVESIQWIESYDHYLKIHTVDQSLLKRSSLEDMTRELKPEFIRIHRKYLVNRSKIAKKEKQKRDEYVVLNSGDRLKVGRTYSPLEW